MYDSARHLVSRVLPTVRMRQYVLTMPYECWGVLGYRPAVMNAVQKAFTVSLQQWHTSRGREYGFTDGKTGGVAVLHRFTSALGIMPHVHVLVADGVYTSDGGFHAFNPPDEAHLRSLASTVARRVLRILRKAGFDSLDEDALGQCTRLALTAGHRSHASDDDDVPIPTQAKRKLAVDVGGFNLEATVAINGEDRDALERMCRYLLRGPVALERLHVRDDGNVAYDLKRPDRFGRTQLLMTPQQLLARMTALIPAPNLCLRRLFGVLAPRAALRNAVIPHAAPVRERACCGKEPTRTPWADLLRHAFKWDPMKCGKCGGALQVMACIRDRDEARRYLQGTGLFVELPSQGRIRGPP